MKNTKTCFRSRTLKSNHWHFVYIIARLHRIIHLLICVVYLIYICLQISRNPNSQLSTSAHPFTRYICRKYFFFYQGIVLSHLVADPPNELDDKAKQCRQLRKEATGHMQCNGETATGQLRDKWGGQKAFARQTGTASWESGRQGSPHRLDLLNSF